MFYVQKKKKNTLKKSTPNLALYELTNIFNENLKKTQNLPHSRH